MTSSSSRRAVKQKTELVGSLSSKFASLCAELLDELQKQLLLGEKSEVNVFSSLSLYLFQ